MGARKATSGHLLIGATVGLVGVALYTVPMLAMGQQMPWAYHAGNALKVVGGVLGGWIAARRAKPAAA